MSALIRNRLAFLYGLVGAVLLSAALPAAGNAPDFDNAAALNKSQAAIGGQLGDYVFRNRRGQTVRLSDYRGKPLIISLVYTSCNHVCSVTTRQLAKVVKVARDALGPDSFRVVTIGFDTPVDTPPAMAAFARQQGVEMPGWEYLSGDADVLDRLMDDVGFSYYRSPKGFDHMIQATVVDGEGRVHVQVYGELIETPVLVEPLKQLVFGTQPDDSALAGLVNKVRLFCTTYDPANDAYRFDYSLFVGMFIGAGIIGSTLAFLIREMRRNRLSRQT